MPQEHYQDPQISHSIAHCVACIIHHVYTPIIACNAFAIIHTYHFHSCSNPMACLDKKLCILCTYNQLNARHE